jgi:hypothetical protein
VWRGEGGGIGLWREWFVCCRRERERGRERDRESKRVREREREDFIENCS